MSSTKEVLPPKKRKANRQTVEEEVCQVQDLSQNITSDLSVTETPGQRRQEEKERVQLVEEVISGAPPGLRPRPLSDLQNPLQWCPAPPPPPPRPEPRTRRTPGTRPLTGKQRSGRWSKGKLLHLFSFARDKENALMLGLEPEIVESMAALNSEEFNVRLLVVLSLFN